MSIWFWRTVDVLCFVLGVANILVFLFWGGTLSTLIAGVVSLLVSLAPTGNWVRE